MKAGRFRRWNRTLLLADVEAGSAKYTEETSCDTRAKVSRRDAEAMLNLYDIFRFVLVCDRIEIYISCILLLISYTTL